MFLCASAFLDYLGHIRSPETVQTLHVANAGILGDDHQIASLLRCLACFNQLRCLKLPLPSFPLALREVVSLRLALPRLVYFTVAQEKIEGADVWPQGWPAPADVWATSEMITPLSVFTFEFEALLSSTGNASAEWARLAEHEQRYWVDAVSHVRDMYHRSDHVGSRASHSTQDAACDTVTSSSDCEGMVQRATPEVREMLSIGSMLADGGGVHSAFDAERASTHGVQDWRAEERSALRGVLGMKPSDICKEKTRLRREVKGSRPNEGVELDIPNGSGRAKQAPAERDQCAREVQEGGMQQSAARERGAQELGGEVTAGEV